MTRLIFANGDERNVEFGIACRVASDEGWELVEEERHRSYDEALARSKYLSSAHAMRYGMTGVVVLHDRTLPPEEPHYIPDEEKIAVLIYIPKWMGRLWKRFHRLPAKSFDFRDL